MERLAERRMHMDGAGDVLKKRTHFKCQRELGRKLRDMLADSLDPEHPVITLARNDTDKPARISPIHRQGTPIGRERKLSDNDIDPLPSRIGRRKPGADQLTLARPLIACDARVEGSSPFALHLRVAPRPGF